MIGQVHSIESFGTVDGPGIRLVVFLQGCPLRCAYCHNPDTWDKQGGKQTEVEEILSLYRKNRSFYEKGGITVTGGEPLLQAEFVKELFCRAKEEGIHTCLDTSGITFDGSDRLDGVLEYTDLVMLDIKAICPALHKKLTGADNKNVLAFARYLSDKNLPLWVRHVAVPGVTDDPEHLQKLGEFIGTLKNLKALDVLPYHTLGVHKYKELGLSYQLEGVPPMSAEGAAAAKEQILKGIRKARAGR